MIEAAVVVYHLHARGSGLKAVQLTTAFTLTEAMCTGEEQIEANCKQLGPAEALSQGVIIK